MGYHETVSLEACLRFTFSDYPLPEQHSNAGGVSIKPSFPTGLFQVGGFHIQSFEQPWSQPILTLVERPSIDHGLLRKHVTLHPHHRQLIESYLSPCLPQNCSIEIDYSPKSCRQPWTKILLHHRRPATTEGCQAFIVRTESLRN